MENQLVTTTDAVATLGVTNLAVLDSIPTDSVDPSIIASGDYRERNKAAKEFSSIATEFRSRMIEVALQSDSFVAWFSTRVEVVEKMLDWFPKAGSKNRTRIFTEEFGDKMWTRSDYVEHVLGISLHYLNSLIKTARKDKGEPPTEQQQKRTAAAAKAAETRRARKEEADRAAEESRQAAARAAEESRQAGAATATEEVIDGGETLDKSDPYYHFHQLREEPQTMANEIAGMLLSFNYDLQQVTEVLDLARKIAKKDFSLMKVAN